MQTLGLPTADTSETVQPPSTVFCPLQDGPPPEYEAAVEMDMYVGPDADLMDEECDAEVRMITEADDNRSTTSSSPKATLESPSGLDQDMGESPVPEEDDQLLDGSAEGGHQPVSNTSVHIYVPGDDDDDDDDDDDEASCLGFRRIPDCDISSSLSLKDETVDDFMVECESEDCQAEAPGSNIDDASHTDLANDEGSARGQHQLAEAEHQDSDLADATDKLLGHDLVWWHGWDRN